MFSHADGVSAAGFTGVCFVGLRHRAITFDEAAFVVCSRRLRFYETFRCAVLSNRVCRRCDPRRVMYCLGVVVREVPMGISMCVLTCGRYSLLILFSCVFIFSPSVLLDVACNCVAIFVFLPKRKYRCGSTVVLPDAAAYPRSYRGSSCGSLLVVAVASLPIYIALLDKAYRFRCAITHNRRKKTCWR